MVILPLVALLGLIALFVYFYFYSKPKDDTKYILAGTQAGNVKSSQQLGLPLSMNEPEGLTFSYSLWFLVRDFNVGYGTRRTILNKGNCPGIYIDATPTPQNSLTVAIKTHTGVETVLIPNIPALKWMHLAVVVNQQSVDVYINGTLRQHHTLGQLPDQVEDAPVEIGGEWDGVVGQVAYYPRSLSYNEIYTLASAEPPPYQDRTVGKKNYFDISWYIGRLNSA
jgi:hypothetical protein